MVVGFIGVAQPVIPSPVKVPIEDHCRVSIETTTSLHHRLSGIRNCEVSGFSYQPFYGPQALDQTKLQAPLAVQRLDLEQSEVHGLRSICRSKMTRCS